MKPEFLIKKSVDEIILLAAEEFYKTVQESGERVNISLSGGNTPKLLFGKIVELYADKMNWSIINIWWGDERCVPPDHIDSNYRMTREYLLDHINIPSENIYRIMGEYNPINEAQRYAALINKKLPSINNLPRYNLIYLGLGEDGHTASIFPDQIELFGSNELCVPAKHPSTAQKRVSITGKVINNADKVLFLITGNNKAKVIGQIINKKPEASKYPASLVNPDRGEYKWFLDKAAASEI